MTLPKTILVPTDFGDAAKSAVDYAIPLAKTLGAQIVLVHTYEMPVVGFPDGAMVVTADLGRELVEGAQVGLDKELERLREHGVTLRGVIKQGDACESILDTAEEMGAELIVMGTHGRKGLPRLLVGSVAEKIVRLSKVPVLTVHAGEIEEARDTTPEATVPTSERSPRSQRDRNGVASHR